MPARDRQQPEEGADASVAIAAGNPLREASRVVAPTGRALAAKTGLYSWH